MGCCFVGDVASLSMLVVQGAERCAGEEGGVLIT